MGIWDKLKKGEHIDSVEWVEATQDMLLSDFHSEGHEIKIGATLTVKDWQSAVFAHNNKIADVLGPGMYELTPHNLPILSILKRWKPDFSGSFISDIFFLNTGTFKNVSWTPSQPVVIKDTDFGAVKIKISGAFDIAIIEPVMFIKHILQEFPGLNCENVLKFLTLRIANSIAKQIPENNIAVIDIVLDKNHLATTVQSELKNKYQRIGVEVSNIVISEIVLPEAVKKAFDKRLELALSPIDEQTLYKFSETIEAEVKNPTGAHIQPEGKSGDEKKSSPPISTIDSDDKIHPPPVPKYYTSKKGIQSGPFDLDVLKEMIQRSEVSVSTLIWKEGMNTWDFAENFDELKSLFQ